MIALVCGATATVRRHAGTGLLGALHTPRRPRRPPDVELGLPWACDNDAFSGFDEARYVTMLERHAGMTGCLWVAAPDVVGDAAATSGLFSAWAPTVAGYGYPVALVAQDGLLPAEVPWEQLDALFIGGTTAWKLGAEVRALIAAALDRGKWVHVGRVNWWGRIRYFRELGAHSFDGSSLSRWPDVWLPYVINLLQNPQLTLEDA